MQLLQGRETVTHMRPPIAPIAPIAPDATETPVGGLAGWLLDLAHRLPRIRSVARAAQPRQLQVLETLALGPRRQLQLIRCGNERFLVGSGPDSVQTILQVGPDRRAHEDTPSCH